MIFIKEIINRRANILRSTLVLLAGTVLMTALYAGCALRKTPDNPDVTASSVQTEQEDKGPYKKYDAKLANVEDNVSKFDFGLMDDRESPEAVISGKYIYFLSRVSGRYEMRKINTEDLSDAGLAQINEEGDYFCSLLPFGVRVESNDKVTFMDLDLNVIYSLKNTEAYEYFIPYKDTYLIQQGDDLSILKDGKLEPYKKLNNPNYVVIHQQILADNTKIVLNYNDNTGPYKFYIYDVNADSYEEIAEMGFNYNDTGFYDVNPLRLKIRNLSEPKEQEFENKYPGIIGNSFFDGTKLFICDEGDTKIRYYDPSSQMICTLSDHEFAKYGVNFIGNTGKKVICLFRSELYVVDIANREELHLEEFKIKLHGEIVDIEDEIRDKYSVNILTGEAAAKHIRENVEADAVKEETRVLYSIKKIAVYIRRFGKEFFDDFRYGTSKGLYILLTGYTQVTNDGAKIDAGGVAFRQDDIFYIILNINNEDPARNFCHEIMHSMEQNSDSDTLFPEWKKYNPKGFKYADSYAEQPDPKFTFNGSDDDEVYFMDEYSKTNAMEDRARVFENMLAPDKKEECQINGLPRLKAKATYIRERLCKVYTSLKNTDIFKNLDG